MHNTYLWLLVTLLFVAGLLSPASIASAEVPGPTQAMRASAVIRDRLVSHQMVDVASQRAEGRVLEEVPLSTAQGTPELIVARARFDAQANTPPTISDLPNQEVPINGSALGVIDLWAFAGDTEDADEELTFTINNAPTTEAGVSIDGNRYVDINPATDWTGETEVEIQVEDTGGLTDSDTFRVTVEPYSVYLPLVMKRYPPIPDTPVLNPINNPDGDGTYAVSWSTAYLAETYVLQEDDNAAFSSPTQRYSGSSTSWNASGKSPGTYYYRVKASNTWGDSSWSNVRQVTVSPPRSEVYVQNDTGGKLCYEVYGTGIGERCFSSGRHFYGSFPSGTYRWHASARCGSASGSEYYPAREFVHRFWCG